MKKIVICADGTWNRPEEKIGKDYPTNILKMARAISPLSKNKAQQVVFYDWGLGSYYNSAFAGGFGVGINKNIQDCYRFIVQNYNHPKDELYFFGFSRGAYTVRSLAGLIYNCGIVKRDDANLISDAFNLYKNRREHPEKKKSIEFRKKYSYPFKKIKFIGVFDTVGALGVPISFLGFLNEKHLFHDNKLGPIVESARHALAIDEKRKEFEPTIWTTATVKDLKQVWFAGVHSDIGGSYPPDKHGNTLADIPLSWLIREAEAEGLKFEPHIKKGLTLNPLAAANKSYKGLMKVMGKEIRSIPAGHLIHKSVHKRWENTGYMPKSLDNFLKSKSWQIEK